VARAHHLLEEPEAEGAKVTEEDEDQLAAVEGPEEKALSLRRQGLGLVLLVVVARPLVAALEQWFAKPSGTTGTDDDPTLWALWAIVVSLSQLCLLAYVLSRQGRSLGHLGVTARWLDLAHGLGLAILIRLPYMIGGLATHGAFGISLVSGLSMDRASLIELVGLLCLAARRELVLCAYLMTEVMVLTSSAVLAVVASIGLQALVHPSSRIPTLVSLLIRCLYYWKTRRATPLLLADLVSGLWVTLHTAGAGG